MRATLTYLVLLSGFSPTILIAAESDDPGDHVHWAIVSELSNAHRVHIVHHLSVGGLPVDLAADLATAAIEEYSGCITLSAMSYAEKFESSFESMVITIFNSHWEPVLTSERVVRLDVLPDVRLARDCEEQLRDIGGIQK